MNIKGDISGDARHILSVEVSSLERLAGSYGPNYYRIQVKTVAASDLKHYVSNQWKESNVDCIVYFARNSNWGCVAPAFLENKRSINHPDHKIFEQNKKSFLKAFHLMDVWV